MARILYARVFVAVDATGKAMKLGSTALNTIVTDKKLPAPTQLWRQVFTKGAVDIAVNSEFKAAGNDQQGDTEVYVTKMPLKVSLPLETTSFDNLMEFAKLDPNAASNATAGFYRENSGVNLTDRGCTFLIYDKNTDPDNDSDVPDPLMDDNAQIFWNLVNMAGSKISYNGEQDVFNLELTPLANKAAGSAKGTKGGFGSFTFAA